MLKVYNMDTKKEDKEVKKIYKKNVSITVDAPEWEHFKRVANAKNDNASRLIRDYILKYLKNNSQLDLV